MGLQNFEGWLVEGLMPVVRWLTQRTALYTCTFIYWEIPIASGVMRECAPLPVFIGLCMRSFFYLATILVLLMGQ